MGLVGRDATRRHGAQLDCHTRASNGRALSLSLSLSLSGIFPGISSRAQVSCLSSGILFFLRYPLPLVYCDMMLLSLILSSPPNPVRSFTMSACVDTPMTTEIRHMLP